MTLTKRKNGRISAETVTVTRTPKPVSSTDASISLPLFLSQAPITQLLFEFCALFHGFALLLLGLGVGWGPLRGVALVFVFNFEREAPEELLQAFGGVLGLFSLVMMYSAFGDHGKRLASAVVGFFALDAILFLASMGPDPSPIHIYSAVLMMSAVFPFLGVLLQ